MAASILQSTSIRIRNADNTIVTAIAVKAGPAGVVLHGRRWRRPRTPRAKSGRAGRSDARHVRSPAASVSVRSAGPGARPGCHPGSRAEYTLPRATPGSHARHTAPERLFRRAEKVARRKRCLPDPASRTAATLSRPAVSDRNRGFASELEDTGPFHTNRTRSSRPSSGEVSRRSLDTRRRTGKRPSASSPSPDVRIPDR